MLPHGAVCSVRSLPSLPYNYHMTTADYIRFIEYFTGNTSGSKEYPFQSAKWFSKPLINNSLSQNVLLLFYCFVIAIFVVAIHNVACLMYMLLYTANLLNKNKNKNKNKNNFISENMTMIIKE